MITLIFGMTTGFANNNPETTERKTYNVVANSGLKMRSGPELNSRVIKIIPYGDRVYEVADSIMKNDMIEWMSGKWIKIEHQGDQGYVFNGFLTDLPIPHFDFELTVEDLDLMSPLESWLDYRFDEDGPQKVYEEKDEIKLITHFVEGHKKIEKETEFMYRVTVQLKDVDMHEAYNILKGMCLTGYEKTSFVGKSLFITNKWGKIDKIKINLDMPIEIKQISNTDTEIRITSFHEGCKL